MTKPHLDALFRTARRMTGDAQTAEDVVQEACLKAFRGFHGFKLGTNYKAWIFRIMTNTCIDWQRRQATQDTVELHAIHERPQQIGAWPQPGARQDEDPEVNFLHQAFRDDVQRAVTRLTPEVRIVVVLALFEEYSYAEIADSVGCPVGTVRSRLNRGRQQLQAYLCAYRTAQMVGEPAVAPTCGPRRVAMDLKKT